MVMCLTGAKPKHTVLRWVGFLPAGVVLGLIVSTVLYYISFVILSVALFFAPGWFIEAFATVVNGWSLGGITVGTAVLVAPSHRKVVGLCVAGGSVFVAGGFFITGLHSGNTMIWLAAIGQVIGSCIGAAYPFSSAANGPNQVHYGPLP